MVCLPVIKELINQFFHQPNGGQHIGVAHPADLPDSKTPDAVRQIDNYHGPGLIDMHVRKTVLARR